MFSLLTFPQQCQNRLPPAADDFIWVPATLLYIIMQIYYYVNIYNKYFLF